MKRAYRVVDHSYYEAAAWTRRDVLVVRKLLAGDLESVTTRAWVVVYGLLVIPSHILDLNLVVVGAHRW